MKLKKDQRVIMTFGEYSDRHILGDVVVLKGFDTVEVSRQYVQLYGRGCVDEEDFLSWLMVDGYVKVQSPILWDVGVYGSLTDNKGERIQYEESK